MATLSAPTIEELLVDVRLMLRQPSAANSTWQDEELAAYLNEGVRRYFAEAVKHGEGQFTTTANLNIVADTETVALPTDCFSVKTLYRTVSGGYAALAYRNNMSEGYSTTGASGGDAYVPYYYFRGNNLVLRPVPNFSETAGLKIEYVQFPETMLTGGDSMTAQVSPVFRDLIVTYAVYKAKLSDSLSNGTDTFSAVRDNLNDLFTAFKDSISPRSYGLTAIKPFNPEDI